MKTASRMSGADRRTAIISAAQKVFIEKGFYRTTTRELAEAAGSRRRFCQALPQQKPFIPQSRCPASRKRDRKSPSG